MFMDYIITDTKDADFMEIYNEKQFVDWITAAFDEGIILHHELRPILFKDQSTVFVWHTGEPKVYPIRNPVRWMPKKLYYTGKINFNRPVFKSGSDYYTFNNVLVSSAATPAEVELKAQDFIDCRPTYLGRHWADEPQHYTPINPFVLEFKKNNYYSWGGSCAI